MTRRPLAIAAAWTCALVAGCGSPASTVISTAATPTTPVLQGTPVATARFSTEIPPGWVDKINDSPEVQKFGASGQVELLAEQGPQGQVQQDVNDVTANINVLLLTTPVPDDQLGVYLQSVSTNGATNLSSAQSFTIDGATGQFISYDRDIKGTPGESQDMLINHGGDTFEIVLNTSQYAFTAQHAGLQAVLAAWRWIA